MNILRIVNKQEPLRAAMLEAIEFCAYVWVNHATEQAVIAKQRPGRDWVKAHAGDRHV